MIEEIIKSFSNLTPILWVSQIAGLIGFVIVTISYQFPRKKFLAVAGVSYIFFIIEQVLALLFANLIVTTASLIRNIWMLILLIKKDKNIPFWQLLIFIFGIWVAIIIYMAITNTFGDWTNYLPPILITEFTILQNFKNPYLGKLGAFIHEGGFLIYYIVFSLPFSALRQAILVTSVVVSVIIMIIKAINNNKKEKTNNNLEVKKDV